MRLRVLTCLLLLACLAGCSGHGPRGTVVGTVRVIGGPAPGVNLRTGGTVIATNRHGHTWRAITTKTVPFTLSLPPGSYRLGNGEGCEADGPVVVAAQRTLNVDVVCNIP
jgi:hypothetical protein